MVLVDLRGIGMTGKVADLLVSEVNITANKNTVPFDPESPFVTSGLRLAPPHSQPEALTGGLHRGG